MNLVQLSEQLKDVPDNFLMMEVQNPSGSYPAYLIVSEMTRRKRMRENAPKQEPQTTVAEDLMGGGIRAMQPQMPQQMPGAAQTMASQMPQMPTQQPQMPQAPQMMAGGGLVAFEQGGPIRAFDGLFVDPTMPEPEREDVFRKPLVPIPPQLRGTIGLSEAKDIQAGRYGTSEAAILSSFGITPQRVTTAPSTAPSAAPAGAQAGAAPAPATATRTSPGDEAMRMARELATTPYPGYDMEAGIARLRQTMPDTASQAMADYIKRQEGQMAGQRESNLNMALMQAGLGMMGSKARSGIQGIAEGGLEGLKAYRQGVSELQKGEQQIELARMKMAEAKDARERGLYDLAMKEQATSMELFKQGQEAKFRGASVMATVDAGRQRGRTVDTTPSPAEIDKAGEIAAKQLTSIAIANKQSLDINSPQYMQQLELLKQQILAQSGKIYTPMMMGAPAPQRGDFNTITAGS